MNKYDSLIKDYEILNKQNNENNNEILNYKNCKASLADENEIIKNELITEKNINEEKINKLT